MGNESTRFDDVFESEFEDEFGLLDEKPGSINDLKASLEDLVDEFATSDDGEAVASDATVEGTEFVSDDAIDDQAPMGDVGEEIVAPISDEPILDGGALSVPAISIHAFWQKPSTRDLLEKIAADRRLTRASLEIIEGGLDEAVRHQAENATPNLLIVESDLPAAQMVAQIDALAGHCDEGVEVLVIGAMNDISLYRQLVDRGVSEYIVPPVQPVQLIHSISSLFEDPDAPFYGKLISVVGAKGGVGSSTIAHNLAWAVSEGARLNACLVDLDLSFGTTALDFNQEPNQTVAEALGAPDRADQAVISRLLIKATDRLSIFAAPATVTSVMEYTAEAYDTVLEAVRRTMPNVILDLPHGWSSWQRKVLVSSDEVILVCQPDLASLRNGKNLLDQLKAERPNDAAPRLVLNMAGVPKRPEIPVKDFAVAIGAEPEIILPFEPQLFGTAANNGQMISEADPEARSSLAIDHLASKLTGKKVSPLPKSFLQKLLGQ
ncbi:MAG: AAA family ATPase [Pseudomonadota bacterium]